MKQTLKMAVMLLVVAALTTAGIALAQSGGDTSVFVAAADTTDADETAPTDERPVRARILEWLTPLVEDETITQEQAEAVADTLVDRLPPLRPGLVRGLHVLDEAADFLGITVREVVEALRDGTTLAELAGDAAEDLVDHLLEVFAEHLDRAVAAGYLTEDEAAQRLDEAAERLADLVNGDVDLPGPGLGFGGRPPGGGFGHGPGRGPCSEDAGSSLIDPGA